MRPIDISEINTKLNQEVCDALLGLHAFTGCDSASAFLGKGKKKDGPKMPTSRSSNAKLVDDYLLNACERPFLCLSALWY